VLRRKFRTLRGLQREGYFAFLRPRAFAHLVRLYLLDRRGRGRYRALSEEELVATRRSDTAFVFGSGRSLVDIPEDDWKRMSEYDTISLREFPRQQWIRADYHLTSEVDFVDEYAERLRTNPRYADTVFVTQEGFRAERGNELVGRGLYPAGARIFRYRRRRSRIAPPSRGFAEGMVHGSSSIFDATNFAYLMGYRRIVLVGVDLYNKEYFWLGPGETRPYEAHRADARKVFLGAEPIVSLMTTWYAALAMDGVELLVYNPRSLLAERIPVFAWEGSTP
jgi:hypothetical protein